MKSGGRKPEEMRMLDVLIVGSGPAGLTAGLYAARAGLDAVLLEKSMAGGQAALTNQIDNYPGFSEGIGGPELSMAMEQQAVKAGLTLLYEPALEIDCAGKRVRTDSGWHEARRLVLAMGARARVLGVEGEQRLTGSGVSYCATCDGAFYRGKRVVVVGGGNGAAEEALYLVGLGCEVLLIHRRDTLRAEQAVAERVLAHPRVHVLWNRQVKAFLGEKKLAAVRLDDGREEAVEGAFISIGRVPETDLVKGQLSMDAEGFLLAGEDCLTSVPGVYAAGDVRTKTVRQIVTATADGAVAVHGLEKV